jgi:hypothetical protein
MTQTESRRPQRGDKAGSERTEVGDAVSRVLTLRDSQIYQDI